jgi:potassium-transporting ATPase KdpC subunit
MRTIVNSIVAVLVLTVVFGIAWPLVATGFASVAFGDKARGSLVIKGGKAVGSHLAAQEFKGSKYFHERLSATTPAFNAAGTTFSNFGPTSDQLTQQVSDAVKAIMALEGPYNRGMTVHDIPVDAVTTSGSGIDPDISPAYAQLQAPRIAAVRKLPIATVKQLISQSTDGRSLGFLGEPGVNVLDLNLRLDQVSK